jgi:hypothetical protein
MNEQSSSIKYEAALGCEKYRYGYAEQTEVKVNKNDESRRFDGGTGGGDFRHFKEHDSEKVVA